MQKRSRSIPSKNMTANQLLRAVKSKKCVTGFIANGLDRMPAAFVVGMPFRLVARYLPQMKIYKPKKK